MANESNIILGEDTVRLVGTGESPVVDIEGGDNWNLGENDGDLRIGDDENMLKMGVALGGGGAGNGRIWATSKLRLGSNGTSVLNIDDTSVNPHNGDYELGTLSNPWKELHVKEHAHIGGQIYCDGNLNLEGGGGPLTGRAIVKQLSVSEGAFTITPLGSGQNLGSSDSRWDTVFAKTTDTASDRRLKTDIEDLTGGLDAVLDLRPVSYTWKDDGTDTHLGLVGQEVADVLPEVVNIPEDDEGYLGVDYTELVAVLVDAIQDQHADKEELTTRVEHLEEHIEDQQARIDDLEERLTALE